MRLDYIASLTAPIATPLAPATILMSGLYSGMVASGVNSYIAFIPAISSGVGMELSGFLAGSLTFRAIKERDLAGGILAAIGIVGYVSFAALGMSKIPNAGVFQAFVLMSLVAYFVTAIYQYFEDKVAKKSKERIDKNDDADRATKAEKARMENDIAMLKAQTENKVAELAAQAIIEKEKSNQARADARKAKSQVSNGGVHGGQFKANPDLIKAIADFWKNNPTASDREVAKACKCSPMTAKKYKVIP
jgi:hypothetical protein